MYGVLRFTLIALTLLALFFGQPAVAQIPGLGPEKAGGSKGDSKEAAVDPTLAETLANPRATMGAFLETMNEGNPSEAARCLDLSHLDKQTAAVKGPEYAYKLKETLNRMAQIDPSAVPDDRDAEEPFVVGSILADKLQGSDAADANLIVISRDNNGLWRFANSTVTEIDRLYDRWKDRPEVEGAVKSKEPFPLWLRKQFPERLRATSFLLPHYQWICLAALVFLGFLADLVTRFLMHYLNRAWLKLIKSVDQIQTERKLWRPVGLLAQALVWYGGTTLIGLPELALMILLTGLKLFAVVAAVWTAFLLVNLFSAFVATKAARTDTKFDDLLIPLISKSLKALAVVIGVLMCAEAFELPIMGLLGGLGVGGIALALASKDAVSNFFGSVTVMVDRPFEIGDWVITNDVEGTVETVGFRSTRIRTFYNSLITVPNCLLTTAIVDNMGRRRYRRIKAMLGLEYNTTPAQIEAFCEGIRELIRRHPYTRKDYYHVYLNALSDSSIDVLLYCFVQTPDWAVELREKHRLFVDIMKLASDLRVSFAFPTRTLHMFNEEPSDTGPPEPLSEPASAGQQVAARIVGPPLPPTKRPGPVRFTGPTPVESDEPDDLADADDGQ